MANKKVEEGWLSTFDTPKDMRFDMAEYVDISVESDEDADLIRYLSNETTAYSKFQIDSFVVSGEITDPRKIRQIGLEVRQRMVSLAEGKHQLKKADIKLRKLQRRLDKEEDDLERELLQEEIDKTRFDMEYTRQVELQNEVEIKQFLAVLKKIAPNDTMKTLEHYKDNWEEKEEDYWSQRMAKQAMMDMLTMGKISSGNMESIMGMPLALQQKTIGQAIANVAQVEKGILQIQDKVRNLLITHETNEPAIALPNITGVEGDFGGEKTKSNIKIKVESDGGIKAIENQQTT